MEIMKNKLSVSHSPHIFAKTTTASVMIRVLIALLPAVAASVVIFGVRSLLLISISVISCVLFEFLYEKALKKPITIYDLSAAVTGVLLALGLPVNLPWWMPIIGSFAAIVVTKQLFGGIGHNFANPAIVGRIVMLLSFGLPMTSWVLPQNSITPDEVVGATILGSTWNPKAVMPSYMEMFLGNIGGSLGETCKIALLIGFIYLVIAKIITVTIPVSYMATVFIVTWVLGADPVLHLLSGGLMLGAIFMATDYSTSPTSEKGKLIFGIGCGILTALIRIYGAYPEGASFAILFMNILTPHIDNLTAVKAFGGVGK